MNKNKSIISVLVVLVTVIMLGIANVKPVYAADEWTDSYTFYYTFKDSQHGLTQYNENDGCIYLGRRTDGSGVYTIGYKSVGWRVTYMQEGVTYYVEFLRENAGGKYETRVDWKEVSGYKYNLQKIPLTDIYHMFETKYPDVDFSAYFRNEDAKLTLEFDSLMTYTYNSGPT